MLMVSSYISLSSQQFTLNSRYYSDEFLLMRSEIFLQAQSELFNNNYGFIN